MARSDLQDVVVVGGGVLGAATLFELARRGLRGVLLDRGRAGAESTGKSAAIVRMHYSNPPVVRMALRSRQLFREFSDLTGGKGVYHPIGWTILVPPELDEPVAASIDMNREQGSDIDQLSEAEAAELFPGIALDAGVAAIYHEPGSGYADPLSTVRGYVDAARRLGAEVKEGAAVRSVIVESGRVAGVTTSDGVISAGIVVLAAGPWSQKLASPLGLDLGYRVTREQEILLDVPLEAAPRGVLSSASDRIYMRPEADPATTVRVLVGRGYPKEYEPVDPDAYRTEVDTDFERDVRSRIRTRFPRFGNPATVSSTVGLYAATPDWHPHLGSVDELDGLVLCTGGSGHCFKLAPAIGEMVAASIVGQETDYADIALFNLRRINQGSEFASAIGGNRA
jgi:sarcosine oxidase, subunit beta